MKFLPCALAGLLLGPVAAFAQITTVTPTGNAIPDATPAPGATTLWDLVSTGGWAMIPLAILSVVTVMLVLTYLVTLRRGAVVSAHFMNAADVLLKKRDYHGLLAISSRHGEAVARIVQRTLDFATRNPNADFSIVREIAETEGSTQAASFQHRIIYLADIGMLSPMIGLLGTVVGIIKSFGVLASRQTAEASRNVLLAGGVSEALIATAGGLVLGITSMAFYAFFRGRVQRLISDLEIATTHILGLLALNYNRRRPDPSIEKSRVGVEDEF
jgi:biopolymer transport protein ExbB